jgi:DNA polymerase-3 subunit beta
MATLTVKPQVLSASLTALRPVVAHRSAIAALTGVRIMAGAAGVRLIASDLQVFAERTLPDASCDGELDCVVSHRALATMSRLSAAAAEVALTYEPTNGKDPDRLVCVWGSRTVTLQTLRLEDFPSFPMADGRRLFSADGAELAEALERAGRFASTDDSRPVLCAINLDWESELRLVACDSYRLAVIAAPTATEPRKRAASTRLPEPNRLTITAKGLLLAARSMRTAGEVEVLTGSECATVRWLSARFAVRLADGLFPTWRNLIPDGGPTRIIVPVAELVTGCEIAEAFASHGAPVRLHANGEVKLHGGAVDGPSFEQILEGARAEVADGNAVEVAFNPTFLLSVARACHAETVVIKLRGSSHTVLFEDEQDRYLVMPHS